MKSRDFDKMLNRITTGKGKQARIDVDKVKYLTNHEKQSMVFHIVRNRGPVVKELIPPILDWGNGNLQPFTEWLAAMGYLYETKTKYFTFVHTAAHAPNIAAMLQRERAL